MSLLTMKYLHCLLAVGFLALLSSCNQHRSPESQIPSAQARKGVAEVEPIEAGRVVAGQTIYVPAYSSVPTADRAEPFNLAITLSIRNTDRSQPIVVTTARYYDQDGKILHDYLRKPLRIGPMASTEFFVRESDTRGGITASFLVEWVAEQRVSNPVVESVMVGVASSRGISFVCPGRVLTDRSSAGPRGDASR
jgi:Protein of unknown function (DUF3124)